MIVKRHDDELSSVYTHEDRLSIYLYAYCRCFFLTHIKGFATRTTVQFVWAIAILYENECYLCESKQKNIQLFVASLPCFLLYSGWACKIQTLCNLKMIIIRNCIIFLSVDRLHVYNRIHLKMKPLFCFVLFCEMKYLAFVSPW